MKAFRAAAVCMAVTLGLVATVGHAGEEGTPRLTFNIPAQPMEQALTEFGAASGLQVLFDSKLAAQITAPEVVGSLSAEDALKKLLERSPLSYEFINPRTVTIRAKDVAKTGVSNIHGSVDAAMRLAQKEPSVTSYAQSSAQAAEDGKDAPNSAARSSIEEIVVTAQKREERLQDVPGSITVISGQDIERRGLIGMEDYLRSIPGVNQIDVGPQSNAIVIRGITTSPQSENFYGGATVATYFDESPITAAAGLGAGGIDVRPVDIERIEVLRGPQGTAFGDASLGGTLRIIPVKPKLGDFGAKLAASYSSTARFGGDNSMVQGVVNVPVVADKFALRAVGYRFDESGFYQNVASTNSAIVAMFNSYGLGSLVRDLSKDSAGRIVSTGGRLAGLWEVTDSLELSMNLLTQKIEQDGSPVATVGTYVQVQAPVAPQARVRGQAAGAADTKMNLANLLLNYKLGWATWTSSASWIDSSSVYAAPLVFAFYPNSSTQPSDFRSFVAETRLASQFDGPFQFLGGLFYENIDESSIQTVDWAGAPAPDPFFGTNPAALFDNQRDLDQRAVFGEVSYKVTDAITAVVGGRYFTYEKNLRALQEGGLVGTAIGAGIPQISKGDEDHTSLKANLSYKPSEDAMVYVSWAQGFRLGRPQPGLDGCDLDRDGIVDGTGITVASTRKVDSDSLDSYEIGGKFAFLARRMVLDAAAYHIEWDGLPVGTTAGPCRLGYTANIGAAVSDGFELQASLYLLEGLRVDVGGGYTKARLSKDAPGFFPPAFDGDRLPGSPKVSANLAAQYEFALAGHRAFVRADSFYAGKFYGDFQEAQLPAAGDYVKVDARAGLEIKSLSVELFVRNLTNDDAFTWRTIRVGDPLFGYRLRPRTIGLQLGYTFN